MNDVYLGIMSGTSLDAIDVAACKFLPLLKKEGAGGWSLELLGFHSHPWPEKLRATLFELATAASVEIDALTKAHFDLATEYDTAVKETMQSCKITAQDVRAIGLHGQTVRHLPPHATLQLGSGPALAVLTGIDVVSDFRAADIALGGQGAPLVPMFDYAFLRSEEVSRLVVNIGGISNVTWIPRSAKTSDVIAFDTGPGNMLIDALALKYFGVAYDRDGEIARSGTIDEKLLGELLTDDYFKKSPPKSTGRELFGENFLARVHKRIEQNSLQPGDALATLTELTARSLAQCFNFVQAASPLEIIVSGGGARNTYMIERIRANTHDARVVSSDVYAIPANAKEAIAFAFFAKAFVEAIPIHLPHTTGASHRVTLGSLSRGSAISWREED
jgi:anhydro-N-acetylmuramic acid kinase